VSKPTTILDDMHLAHRAHEGDDHYPRRKWDYDRLAKAFVEERDQEARLAERCVECVLAIAIAVVAVVLVADDLVAWVNGTAPILIGSALK
jgi:hypothetical protein